MQQHIAQFILPILRFVAPRRVFFIKIFQGVEVLFGLFWFTVLIAAHQNASILSSVLIYEVGEKLGVIALVLYVLTLLPGIINRSKFLPMITQPIGSILLPFRRHLGILMFISAFVHMSLTTTMIQLLSNGYNPFAIQLVAFQLYGMIAWLALLPLWLTSNDQSMRFLGKKWKMIHKLTYIALFFIFLHVSFQNSNYMYVMAVVAIAEAYSWVKEWTKVNSSRTL